MAELGPRELLEEWRRLLESAAASATSAAGRAGVPDEVLGAAQRQVELMQQLIERPRSLPGEAASRLAAPLDALFDLLEETGETLSRQAEALAAAGRALEETADLMGKQSERFERAVRAMRAPTDLAKAAAGAKPRPRRTHG